MVMWVVMEASGVVFIVTVLRFLQLSHHSEMFRVTPRKAHTKISCVVRVLFVSCATLVSLLCDSCANFARCLNDYCVILDSYPPRPTALATTSGGPI